jgi:hypothetical protein
MIDEAMQDESPAQSNELKKILKDSLFGTAGLMWVAGGIFVVINLYDIHWLVGWVAAFVWVWGCWAAALYFDVRRFFS